MTELFVLGLTGSIGMGKSTTAEVFRDAEIAVWDADAAVHELYTTDTATIEKIFDIAPTAVDQCGVNRKKLGALLAADKTLFSELEAIVHPAIREHRRAFIEACKKTKQKLAVVDIPLLYETRAEEWLDAVLVVTVGKVEQRKRVLSRPGMTEEMFDTILSRQLPDEEKQKRSDFVIETTSLDYVRKEVHKLIDQLTNRAANA